MTSETAIPYECVGEQLVGILHAGNLASQVGVVIVVGGPQYRVGSHRQFVIMARSIAEAGYPALRFDYRGMGDSEGRSRSFDTVDDDIRSAIDKFCTEVPSLEKVVLLGLCDAASANLIYAAADDRVQGLILLNPWVRSQQGEAKAYLKHYYRQRFLQRSFWRKVMKGEFALIQSVRGFLMSFRMSRSAAQVSNDDDHDLHDDFIARMLSGFERYKYPVLIQVCGRDLTAREFVDLCESDENWRRCIDSSNVEIQEFPAADHTMSERRHLQDATGRLIDWMTRYLHAT